MPPAAAAQQAAVGAFGLLGQMAAAPVGPAGIQAAPAEQPLTSELLAVLKYATSDAPWDVGICTWEGFLRFLGQQKKTALQKMGLRSASSTAAKNRIKRLATKELVAHIASSLKPPSFQ